MGSEGFIPERLSKFDYRKNLIVDQDNPILIQKAWRDHFSGESYWKSGKEGGKAYLGALHGEDAMTWNVFRSLQKEGPKGCGIIADVLNTAQIEKLLFWGCDVESHGEEQQLLSILIRTTDGELQGTMTEPDVVVITASEVVFVECKLNLTGKQSPWKAQQGSPGRESGAAKRMDVYKKRGFREFEDIEDWHDIYQIIRQYVYSKMLADCLGKKPLVIPLINEDHLRTLEPIYRKAQAGPLNMKSSVLREIVTWQKFFTAINEADLKCREKLLKQMNIALNASVKYGNIGYDA